MTLILSIDTTLFADATTWVSRALPPRPINPILGGILLGAADGALTLSAYDYEVSAKTTAAAAISEPGTALVSGRLLAAVLKTLPRGVVEVREEGTVLRISSGPATFTLPTMDHHNYSTLPQLPPDAGSIDAKAFAAAITAVGAVVGTDIAGHVGLTGIYLQAEPPGELTMVATDRHRLALQRLPWAADTAIPGALVPARGLIGMKITDTDQVWIAMDAEHSGVFAIHAGCSETTFRLLDEKFPNYRQLFPDKHSAVATVAQADLLAALGRAMVVTGKGDLHVQVTLQATGSGVGTMTLTAGDMPEDQIGIVGSSVEELAIGYGGDPLSIAFQTRYLLDGVAAINAPYVRLGFTANNRPAVLQPLDEAYILQQPGPFDAIDTAFLYLLMPLSPPKV